MTEAVRWPASMPPAQVWQATDMQLNRQVALKILL